jgi:hypothetical protein
MGLGAKREANAVKKVHRPSFDTSAAEQGDGTLLAPKTRGGTDDSVSNHSCDVSRGVRGFDGLQ